MLKNLLWIQMVLNYEKRVFNSHILKQKNAIGVAIELIGYYRLLWFTRMNKCFFLNKIIIIITIINIIITVYEKFKYYYRLCCSRCDWNGWISLWISFGLPAKIHFISFNWIGYSASCRFCLSLVSTKNKIKMKLFETTLKNFMVLSLAWNESSKKYSFTKKLYCFQFLCVLCMMSCILFFIYDAKTFYEYALAFTAFSGGTVCIVTFIFLDVEMGKFNNFIENCQNMVKKSK